jgi:hypothetical protein
MCPANSASFLCVRRPSGVLIELYFILSDFHEKGCTDCPQIQGPTINSRSHKDNVKQVFIPTTQRTKLNRKGGLAPGAFVHLWAWILTLENTTKIWWVSVLVKIQNIGNDTRHEKLHALPWVCRTFCDKLCRKHWAHIFHLLTTVFEVTNTPDWLWNAKAKFPLLPL